MRRMFGRWTGAAGALMAAGVALAGCGDAGSCPYGSHDQPSGTASVSCKARPAPSVDQIAALRSGAAVRAALAAHDAGGELIGIGVNAWGETTFTRRGGELVTYDRTGKKAPGSNPTQRNYAIATAGSAPVTPSDVDPAVLARALTRIHRAAPRGKLQEAVYASLGIAPRVGWRLTYFGMGSAGQLLVVDDRPCVLAPGATRSPLQGIGACDVRALLLGGPSAAPPPSSSPVSTGPATPELSKAQEQLECVKAAEGDVTKLTQCATG